MRLIASLTLAAPLTETTISAQAHVPAAEVTFHGNELAWKNIQPRVYHSRVERFFRIAKQVNFICDKVACIEADRPIKDGKYRR